jgi:pimeloyl-ACP methyl ester carboxylesterase
MKSFLAFTIFLSVLGVKANLASNHAGSWPQDSSGFFVSFDRTRIYYEQHGQGKPVLLVHGFTGTGDSWKKSALFTDLVNSGYRVITVDLRGNGKSDKPHSDTAYAHDAEAHDLMGLISFLGIPQYMVVGYSRGSIITARLLVLDKRITRAVMGGIGLDFSNPEWPRRIMFYKALRGDSIPELAPMVKRIQSEGLDQQALAMQQKEQPSTSIKELNAISVPVLVICGLQDSDNGSAADLAKAMPSAALENVPGDHGSASRTTEFSIHVISFLGQ